MTDEWRVLGAAALLSGMLLGGCATTPGRAAAPVAPGPSPAAAAAAKQLYAGAPAAVHGTEYPVESTEEGLRRGDEAWRAGNLDLALYLYVQTLMLDDKIALPLLRIGAVHEMRGNRPLARRAFELALAREPESAATNEHLGLLYLMDGERAAARPLFERALALDPSRWRALNGLGQLAQQDGDLTGAIAAYDAALALEPGAAPARDNRGYARARAGDLDGAEVDIREAIRQGVGDDGWLHLGAVQARRGRYPDALESFLHALDVPKAYNALGRAALENDDLQKARDCFERARAAAPMYYEEAEKNLAIADERLLARDNRRP